MRPRGQPVARVVLRSARQLAAIVLGIALAAALFRGGTRYFFCPLLDAVVDEGCCASAHDSSAAVQEPDCCQARRIGTLPSMQTTAPASQVAAAPLAAFLPAAYVRAPERILAHERFGREPTGPPPQSGVQRASRLMVFLI